MTRPREPSGAWGNQRGERKLRRWWRLHEAEVLSEINPFIAPALERASLRRLGASVLKTFGVAVEPPLKFADDSGRTLLLSGADVAALRGGDTWPVPVGYWFWPTGALR